MAGKWTSGRRKTIPLQQASDDYKPPVKPDGLSPDAEWFWFTFVEPLIESKSVDRQDAWAIVGMCEAWSDYREFRQLMRDNPNNNQLPAQVNMHLMRLVKLATPHGLTKQLREKQSDKPKAIGIAPRRRA